MQLFFSKALSFRNVKTNEKLNLETDLHLLFNCILSYHLQFFVTFALVQKRTILIIFKFVEFMLKLNIYVVQHLMFCVYLEFLGWLRRTSVRFFGHPAESNPTFLTKPTNRHQTSLSFFLSFHPIHMQKVNSNFVLRCWNISYSFCIV